MFGYRSRGHFPNQFSAEIDTREARARAINDRYEFSIAEWSVEQGCEHFDYTPEQLDRYEALMAAEGDTRIARCLIYGQMLYDTYRISEGVR